MELTLSIIIDLIVLLALGVTIFYAVRLSASLNNFKNHRKEFDALIANLSSNIEQAYIAIDKLREASQESGSALQDNVSEARFLIDELKQVNAVSDSLAGRLERAATESRHSVPTDDYTAEFQEDETPSWEDSLPFQSQQEEEEQGGFTIQDREYSSTVTDISTGRRDNPSGKVFASQAEKELFEALQKKK